MGATAGYRCGRSSVKEIGVGSHADEGTHAKVSAAGASPQRSPPEARGGRGEAGLITGGRVRLGPLILLVGTTAEA